MKKNKLVIFDFDGTLFDTNNVNYCSYNAALKECGYNIDYDYFKKYCNGYHYTKFLPEIIGNDNTIIKKIHNIKKEMYSKYLDKAIINNHLIKIAKGLKNEYYLAIVTTASKKNCIELLNKFDIIDIFDLILTSDEISNPKPDPQGFNMAIEHFNVKPTNTIIFEDSDVGIKAAECTGSSVYIVNKF